VKRNRLSEIFHFSELWARGSRGSKREEIALGWCETVLFRAISSPRHRPTSPPYFASLQPPSLCVRTSDLIVSEGRFLPIGSSYENLWRIMRHACIMCYCMTLHVGNCKEAKENYARRIISPDLFFFMLRACYLYHWYLTFLKMRFGVSFLPMLDENYTCSCIPVFIAYCDYVQ